MGLLMTKMWDRLACKQDLRIAMVGLDSAGKTTLLYRLKLGEVLTTIPTIGLNVETVSYKKIRFQIWDVGGEARFRQHWSDYYLGAPAIIFVVDSTDRNRIKDVREELSNIFQGDEMSDAVLLVVANKQDLPDAMSTAELTDKLGLHELNVRQWFTQPASATTGDGIFDGLEWLSRALASYKCYHKSRKSI